jgi:O-antigen/teichoic acid export membrane protein
MPITTCKRKLQALVADEKFSEILTGSAWALAGQVLATGLGLAVSVIIARYYGAEVMGTVAVINSLLGLATVFALLGTDSALLRLLPEHLVNHSPASAAQIYRKARRLVIGASLGLGLLLFLGSRLLAEWVFSKPQLGLYLALSAIFLVCSVLVSLNTQAVRGLRLSRLFGVMLVLPGLANLLLLLLLTVFFFDLDNPVYTLFFSLAVTAISGWIIIAKVFKKKIGPNDQVIALPTRELLAIAMPMLTTTSLFFLTSQSGVIILGIFHPQAQVGYYALAVKLSALVGFILIAINAMAAPRFAELFHAGQIDELFYVAQKSAKLIFWTTTPVLLALVLLGKPLLRLFFGPEFVQAYPALLVLIVGQFVNAVCGSNGFFMNMTGHENILRNVTAITALLYLGLSLALIPAFGIEGAAFAATVGISFQNVILLLYIKRKYGRGTGYLPFLSS